MPCAFTVQEASDAIIRLDRDDEAYVSMLSQPWLPGNKLNSEIHLVHDRTIMDKGSLAFFVLPCVRIGPSGNDAPLAVLCWQPAALRRRAQLTPVGPARGAHVADFRAPVVGVCPQVYGVLSRTSYGSGRMAAMHNLRLHSHAAAGS